MPGAACIAFRKWTLTGKTNLALGRVPSRKVYRVLFADQDRGPGGVKSVSHRETTLTMAAFTAP